MTRAATAMTRTAKAMTSTAISMTSTAISQYRHREKQSDEAIYKFTVYVLKISSFACSSSVIE
ncbi:MAG: hypothetical protein PHO62_05610, partial [Sulfurimonas sp.]|nr:hypothetical protein [Sulfurimonas sp.]